MVQPDPEKPCSFYSISPQVSKTLGFLATDTFHGYLAGRSGISQTTLSHVMPIMCVMASVASQGCTVLLTC